MTEQIGLLEFQQYPCFYNYSQYLHTNCEPGEKVLALSRVTVPLPEPTSQLVTAHHLTEKLSFSSFIHRSTSWNQTIDYPLTVAAVVFHQTLWDSPYNFILSAKSICQCFLSLDTHLTGKVFCQKLNAWVFSLPRCTKRLCYTRTCTMHCCISFGNSHSPASFYYLLVFIISLPCRIRKK